MDKQAASKRTKKTVLIMLKAFVFIGFCYLSMGLIMTNSDVRSSYWWSVLDLFVLIVLFCIYGLPFRTRGREVGWYLLGDGILFFGLLFFFYISLLSSARNGVTAGPIIAGVLLFLSIVFFIGHLFSYKP